MTPPPRHARPDPAELLDALDLLRAAAESAEVGLMVLDRDLRPVLVNRHLRLLHGHEDRAFEPGRFPGPAQLRQPDGQPLPAGPGLFTLALARGEVRTLLGLVHEPSGELRIVDVTVRRLDRDGTLLGLVMTVVDDTRHVRHEQQLQHQAQHDELTGLLNRRGLVAQGQRLLDRLRQDGQAVALHALDVEGLKEVNDRHGHPVGDRLLRAVGAAAGALAQQDGGLACRLGGDEFVVLACDQGRVDERFQQLLDRSAVEHGLSFPLRVTVGTATGSGTGWRLDELLERADTAMYARRARRASRTQPT